MNLKIINFFKMLKKLLFTLSLIIVFTGCGGVPENPVDVDDDVVFCTGDTKVCPDGSFVSRVPPDCEFTPCSVNFSTMPAQKIPLAEIPVLDCSASSAEQKNCPVVGDVVAKMSTSAGEIWIKLFSKVTPKTVENFVGLSERGFYNGLIFHRVIPDFMIQGGDPFGNGTGGDSIWGGEFEDEFSADFSNIRGSLAMANHGPATNSSQFFINQNDNIFLDGRHTIFGQVVSGLSTVDAIVSADRDENDKPLEDVEMQIEVFEVIK